MTKTRTLGLAAVASLAAMLASPAQAGYSAIANGVGAIGWVSGYPDMDSARNAAVSQCRRMGGGSCSASTAEQDDWNFVAGTCNGVPYTSATQLGNARAAELIRIKGGADGNYRCVIEAYR